MKWPRIFINKKSDDDTPPWVKATHDGKLYIDTNDERYRNFFLAQISYLSQWSIEDGDLTEKEGGLNLPKPNWKDFL